MPEIRSALAAVARAGRIGATGQTPGIAVQEVLGRDLVQLSAWPDSYAAVRGRLGAVLGCALPEDTRDGTEGPDKRVLLIAPERFWIAAPMAEGLGAKLAGAFASEQAVVTELGHSRTVLRLAGPAVREVLAKGLPVDLDAAVFPIGRFAQSAIAHISVLVQRLADGADGEARFEVFVPRGFAVTFWEWLVEAAAERGAEVLSAEVLPPAAA